MRYETGVRTIKKIFIFSSGCGFCAAVPKVRRFASTSPILCKWFSTIIQFHLQPNVTCWHVPKCICRPIIVITYDFICKIYYFALHTTRKKMNLLISFSLNFIAISTRQQFIKDYHNFTAVGCEFSFAFFFLAQLIGTLHSIYSTLKIYTITNFIIVWRNIKNAVSLWMCYMLDKRNKVKSFIFYLA